LTALQCRRNIRLGKPTWRAPVSQNIEREVGYQFASSTDDSWPMVFEDLRRRRLLFVAVQQINQMLKEPSQRDLAEAALKRVGLFTCG
jgi:hypothetical protein